MQPAFNVLQPDAVFHGRYRVVRCIKAGGMGAVYEVTDEKTATRRALKVMLPGVVHDPEHRARFAREATITGGIESDHVVRVSDAGIDDATGTPFLVMELLRGEELASLLAKRKVLPAGEVIFYLWQAALALDKTHAAGIVHRDLKPENLFITYRDDGSPCVKILDFGIAKLARGDQAQKTRALGTPLYMAPEQIRGLGALGPRADLYMLAHIAYTTLVGEAYWLEESKRGESLLPLLAKVVSGATEAPSARALRRTGATLPPGFDAWFLKATSVRPEDRFDRATTMITALSQALSVVGPAPAQPVAVSGASAAPQPPGGAPRAAHTVQGTMIYTAPAPPAPAAPIAAVGSQPKRLAARRAWKSAAMATPPPDSAGGEPAQTTGVVVSSGGAALPSRSALPMVLVAVAVLVSLGGVGFVVLRGRGAGPAATAAAMSSAGADGAVAPTASSSAAPLGRASARPAATTGKAPKQDGSF